MSDVRKKFYLIVRPLKLSTTFLGILYLLQLQYFGLEYGT